MISASQVYSPLSPIRRIGRSSSVAVWMWSKIDLGVEALGVLLEARHQLRALHAVGVGGPVVDVGRGHQLAALREPGDQHRLQVGARGVYCGGVAGGAGAQDQQAGVLGRTCVVSVDLRSRSRLLLRCAGRAARFCNRRGRALPERASRPLAATRRHRCIMRRMKSCVTNRCFSSRKEQPAHRRRCRRGRDRRAAVAALRARSCANRGGCSSSPRSSGSR